VKAPPTTDGAGRPPVRRGPRPTDRGLAPRATRGSGPRCLPRLAIAGLGGDSGKTLVSLGLLLLAREKGLKPAAFKKGPDYIDAAWLTWACGTAARNLDTYLMGFDGARASFFRHASPDLSVIEGNRGLYDGSDARGTHSTAELAKALGAPVLLVLNGTKVTRTAAAMVLGCQKMDPGVSFAGVVLNQVSGSRHARVTRQAVEETTGLPVLGVLPRASSGDLLPGRHLGLVTPSEHPHIRELEGNVRRLLDGHLDWEALLLAARRTQAAPAPEPTGTLSDAQPEAGLRIGVVRDSAFTFYYPENLEGLERGGARLIFLSPLSDGRFPQDLDALYIGGGFPETHGPELTAARGWMEGLRAAVGAGLPVYAECGGLMLLSRSIRWEGRSYPMAGVLAVDVEVLPDPQGHGYAELEVDRPNPFFEVGMRLRGHEFHYSRIVLPAAAGTAAAVRRGTGAFNGRDGLVEGPVWAAYTHLHALGCPEWTISLLRAAGDFAHIRKTRTPSV